MKRLLVPTCVLVFAASVFPQTVGQTVTHRSYDTAFLGPPMADPVLQHAKETFVLFGCAYCHGLNLVSRGEATDLMHSSLVGNDENGNRIGPLLRAGIPQTPKLSPMPQFSDLSDRQIAAIVTWIHYARRQGRYQELTTASVASGNAAAGKTYFDRACSSCHAIDRDLAGIGSKYDVAALRAAVLDPQGLKDTKLQEAQQRHHALLENYSADDVANLVAYLASDR